MQRHVWNGFVSGSQLIERAAGRAAEEAEACGCGFCVGEAAEEQQQEEEGGECSSSELRTLRPGGPLSLKNSSP
jgi:hypothetical protein